MDLLSHASPVCEVPSTVQMNMKGGKKLSRIMENWFLSPHICLNMINSELDTACQINNDTWREKAINNWQEKYR